MLLATCFHVLTYLQTHKPQPHPTQEKCSTQNYPTDFKGAKTSSYSQQPTSSLICHVARQKCLNVPHTAWTPISWVRPGNPDLLSPEIWLPPIPHWQQPTYCRKHHEILFFYKRKKERRNKFLPPSHPGTLPPHQKRKKPRKTIKKRQQHSFQTISILPMRSNNNPKNNSCNNTLDLILLRRKHNSSNRLPSSLPSFLFSFSLLPSLPWPFKRD